MLVISDRAAHGDGLAEYLRTRGLECHWTVCLMGAKALSSLKPFDAVVSELILECLQPSALITGLTSLLGNPKVFILTSLEPGDPVLRMLPPDTAILYEPVDPEVVYRLLQSTSAEVTV